MASDETTAVGSVNPAHYPTNPRPLFDTVIDAARLASPMVDGPNDTKHVFVPEGYSLVELDDPHAVPPYIQQLIVVDDADSLINYTNRFSDERSVIIADLDATKITVALDWHTSNEPILYDGLSAQPVTHSAVLKLRHSEEFARWSEIEGKLIDQMAFAEFLDENASDIVDPDPAVMIEIARDLEATQGVAFKAGTRLQTGERSFRYETETHVKGDLVVPQRFRLAIPLFHGEEPTEIEASFRFRPNPDGLKLGFVWRRVEHVRQAQFREIAFRVAEATGRPVYQGRAA